MKVRIIQQVGGTRPDGKPWPPPGAVMEVGVEEAIDLTRPDSHQNTPIAELVEEPEPEPVHKPHKPHHPHPKPKPPEPPAPAPAPVPEPAPAPEPVLPAPPPPPAATRAQAARVRRPQARKGADGA